LGAKVIVTPGQTGMPESTLRPAEGPGTVPTPLIRVRGKEFQKLAADLAETRDEAKLSLRLPAPKLSPVTLKNVIGVLPGSEPRLADEYVLISAHYDHVGTRGPADGDRIYNGAKHYDHVGTRGPADGDRIYNGANDDASGVAAVLALAEAFSPKQNRPARILVFITYFGEEEGMFGSKYYARHPVFPLARTVAAVNFEHMGRTDDLEGDRAGKITASGFDFTSLGDTLKQAAQETGFEAWMHPQKSSAFFDRSDNQPLADEGIPSVTIAVAWIFPDYHRPSDEWDKLNYPNMESAMRTSALAVSIVANDKEVPQWNRSNPKTARYVKAWEGLHGTH